MIAWERGTGGRSDEAHQFPSAAAAMDYTYVYGCHILRVQTSQFIWSSIADKSCVVGQTDARWHKYAHFPYRFATLAQARRPSPRA